MLNKMAVVAAVCGGLCVLLLGAMRSRLPNAQMLSDMPICPVSVCARAKTHRTCADSARVHWVGIVKEPFKSRGTIGQSPVLSIVSGATRA